MDDNGDSVDEHAAASLPCQPDGNMGEVAMHTPPMASGHRPRAESNGPARHLRAMHHVVAMAYCLVDVLFILQVWLNALGALYLVATWLSLYLLIMLWVLISAGVASWLCVGGTGWWKWLETLPMVWPRPLANLHTSCDPWSQYSTPACARTSAPDGGRTSVLHA